MSHIFTFLVCASGSARLSPVTYQSQAERQNPAPRATNSPIAAPLNNSVSMVGDDAFQSPQAQSAAAARMQYSEREQEYGEMDRSRVESLADASMLHESQQRMPHADTSFSSIGRKTNIFNDLSLSASDKSFAAIQDGGFHAGYWKAKYMGDEYSAHASSYVGGGSTSTGKGFR